MTCLPHPEPAEIHLREWKHYRDGESVIEREGGGERETERETEREREKQKRTQLYTYMYIVRYVHTLVYMHI